MPELEHFLLRFALPSTSSLPSNLSSLSSLDYQLPEGVWSISDTTDGAEKNIASKLQIRVS